MGNSPFLFLVVAGIMYVFSGYFPAIMAFVGGRLSVGGVHAIKARQKGMRAVVFKPCWIDVEPALIYTMAVTEIKGCFVRFFYYPETNVVKRSVWVPSDAAAKKVQADKGEHKLVPLHHQALKGTLATLRRLSMPDTRLDGSWASTKGALYENTVRECRSLLGILTEATSKPAARKRVSTSVSTSVVPSSDTSVPHLEVIPLEAYSEVLPPEVEPVFNVRNAVDNRSNKPTPLGEKHEGRLSWFGYAKYPDRKVENKTFACFSIDITYDDGVKNRLRGIDLQRAIEEASVSRNDRVLVYQVKQMEPNAAMEQGGEKLRGKILWHIEKL